MINLLIADDHPIMVGGLELIFEDKADINVIGAVSNGKDLIEYLKNSAEKIHVILLDISMPIMNGLEAAKVIINSKKLSTRIILYSMYVNEANVADAIKIGVDGYLDKGCMGEEIYIAIKAVVEGQRYCSDAVKKISKNAEELINNMPSKREWEVIKEVEKGLQDKEIASKLHIATDTVRDHIGNLRKKYQVNNRTELLHILRLKGLIS